MTARLALDERPRVEPVGVGQLDRDPRSLLDRDVDEPAATSLLAVQQGEQQCLVGEAGGGVVRLVAAGADGRDRMVVVAGGDQQAARRECDEIARSIVGPRSGEAEVGDRHDDQLRVRGGDRRQIEPELPQPSGMHRDDEDIRGRRGADRVALVPRRHRGRRRRCACRRCRTSARGCDRGQGDHRRTGRCVSMVLPAAARS